MQPYGYTREYYGDSTQLLYLRARQYAPSMGRFTAKDPSGLEANPYWYATANPINKIDPMGLFSRQQIANSFGFSTFDSVISYYSRNGSGEHWGFLAALLRALPGDDLRSEIPLIGPLIGKPVKWSTSLAHVNRRLGYSDDAGITVDGTPLRTLVQTRNLLNPTHGPGLSPIWRSDEARYFTIRDRTSRYEEYVDGSFSPDLPDFWAISVAASSNSGAAVQGLYITDRFGQAYESIGTYYAGGLTNLELAYGEGYIEEPTTAGLRSLSLQNPGELSAKISGGNVCFSLGGAIIAGVSTGVCMNRTFISVYSVGAQIGFSGIYNPSFTWKTSFDKTRGWNWAIEDRLNGIFPSDLITMPEVPFTGCENYLPLDIR